MDYIRRNYNNLLALLDALIYKGVIDCSGNPNYPAADAGHVYVVSVAGKIGGGSGTNVAAGDLLLCKVDGTAAGTDGTNWDILEKNIDLTNIVISGGTIDGTVIGGSVPAAGTFTQLNAGYATVASHATTSAIWAAAGSIINFTGSETLTALPAAPQAGAQRTLICAATPTFTHAGALTVQGGVTYTATAGDVILVTATSTTAFKINIIKQSQTGTGATVLANSPTLVTPALGTPASGTLTNTTGLPLAGIVPGTAESDFIVAAASPFTRTNKTLAETRTILGLDGATTTIAVGGGVGTAPAWTTATGTGAPVRATSPALVTPTFTKANIPVSTDLAMGATDMMGQTYVCAGANTPVLPAAAVGLNGTIIAATATAFSVDINATPGTDIFVLAGTPLAAGNKITSDASAFAEVYIECKIAGKWIATPQQGLFIDGGS